MVNTSNECGNCLGVLGIDEKGYIHIYRDDNKSRLRYSCLGLYGFLIVDERCY